MLLAAAAEPVGDAALLMRAAERLGIAVDAAAPAEAAGLIEVGTRVRFPHPLMRSAAYRAADPMQRRGIHHALAEATDPKLDPDRRAWHRASAAAGPDEAVAAELERSADRAQARGGIAAAAAFLERATELTSDPARRGARALAAAQAKREAGAFDAAYELMAIAEMTPLDDLQRARMAQLRAQIVFVSSRGGEVVGPTVSDSAMGLLDAARGLEGLDDVLARDTYLEALGAGMFGGRLCPHGGVGEVAEAARAAPRAPRPERPTDLLMDGLAVRITDGPAAGLEPLRSALGLTGGDDATKWLWQAFPHHVRVGRTRTVGRRRVAPTGRRRGAPHPRHRRSRRAAAGTGLPGRRSRSGGRIQQGSGIDRGGRLHHRGDRLQTGEVPLPGAGRLARSGQRRHQADRRRRPKRESHGAKAGSSP